MDGWPDLVPPPSDWNAINVPPEAIRALGVGPSVVRARAYFMLGESLLRRTKAVEQDAAIYSYVMAHVLRHVPFGMLFCFISSFVLCLYPPRRLR